MKKSMIALALALALAAGACAQDVTASDEYQALEQAVTDLDQQLADTAAALAEAKAGLEDGPGVGMEVPAEVVAVLDEWWAANERRDGSVVELYRPTGYHLRGETKIPRDDLAAHLNSAVDPVWSTEPYLIVADQSRGRYVVTRGVRIAGIASALTFELLTTPDGEFEIVQTVWTNAH